MEDVTLSMPRYWNSRRPEELDVRTACFPVAVAKVRLWCEPELKWVMLVEDQPRICSVMKLLWRKYQTINTIGKQQSIEVEAVQVSKDKLAKKVKAKQYFYHSFLSILNEKLFKENVSCWPTLMVFFYKNILYNLLPYIIRSLRFHLVQTNQSLKRANSQS